jgi:hypothetical protein
MSNQLGMVRAILTTTAARWSNLTEIVSLEVLARTPAPGEWSAMDCLCHLLDAERWVFPVRLQALLSGKNFVGFDPDTQGTHFTAQSPERLAEEFARLRKASLVEFDRLTSEDLICTAQHSELGTVTLNELAHEWAAHDLMHTVQAERAMMQPFILASGPWRSFFHDHDVSK